MSTAPKNTLTCYDAMRAAGFECWLKVNSELTFSMGGVMSSFEQAKARYEEPQSLPPEPLRASLPPDKELAALTWPVKDCLIVVEWTQPAPEQLVIELIKVLLSAGAESVTVWPRWVDYSQPNLEWPAYHQSIRTYRIDMKGVAHAA